MTTQTILLVEDNAQNRYLVTFLLTRRGYDVVQADCGEKALALAASATPDLILLDIQLPGMDGHAVARSLKANPVLKLIPIVAVTSYAMAGDKEMALAAGVEGYVEKPIDPETFVSEIEHFLRPRQPEASA